MKSIFLFFLLHIICFDAFCQSKSAEHMYIVPDSIKAVGFYAEINLVNKTKSKRVISGISANGANLGLGYNKKQKVIEFYFLDKKRKDIAMGSGVYQSGFGHVWNYEWNYNETYPLLILTASDSASNSTIYSGYIYLTNEKKWKLISTRTFNDTNHLKYIWAENKTTKKFSVTYNNRWLLRNNNTWKALDSQTTKPPALRPFSNIDSLAQQKIEEDNLIATLPKDSVTYKEGIFYQSLKAGTGRLVQITDTVVIHYKGWLFSDGSVFDQTKEKPATFPLHRLIRGWQIGVPQCRVGGKIRLYIPSGSAYGIRTFATDIPPNSTLVFDVEVLAVKEKVEK